MWIVVGDRTLTAQFRRSSFAVTGSQKDFNAKFEDSGYVGITVLEFRYVLLMLESGKGIMWRMTRDRYNFM